MAFPEVAVLRDDFAQNSNPLVGGGRWSGKIDSNDDPMLALSGSARATNLLVRSSGKYRGYGGFSARDVEIYTNLVGGVSGGTFIWLHVRQTGAGTATPSGYMVVHDGTAATVSVVRVSAGVETVLNSVSLGVGSTDSLGARITGSLTEAWHKPVAGSWTMVIQTSDATHATPGEVGLGCNDSAQTFGDFFAGVIQVAQPDPPGIGGRGAGW